MAGKPAAKKNNQSKSQNSASNSKSNSKTDKKKNNQKGQDNVKDGNGNSQKNYIVDNKGNTLKDGMYHVNGKYIYKVIRNGEGQPRKQLVGLVEGQKYKFFKHKAELDNGRFYVTRENGSRVYVGKLTSEGRFEAAVKNTEQIRKTIREGKYGIDVWVDKNKVIGATKGKYAMQPSYLWEKDALPEVVEALGEQVFSVHEHYDDSNFVSGFGGIEVVVDEKAYNKFINPKKNFLDQLADLIYVPDIISSMLFYGPQTNRMNKETIEFMKKVDPENNYRIIEFLHGSMTSAPVMRHQMKFIRDMGFLVNGLGYPYRDKPSDIRKMLKSSQMHFMNQTGARGDQIIYDGHSQGGIEVRYLKAITPWSKAFAQETIKNLYLIKKNKMPVRILDEMLGQMDSGYKSVSANRLPLADVADYSPNDHLIIPEYAKAGHQNYEVGFTGHLQPMGNAFKYQWVGPNKVKVSPQAFHLLNMNRLISVNPEKKNVGTLARESLLYSAPEYRPDSIKKSGNIITVSDWNRRDRFHREYKADSAADLHEYRDAA